MRFYTVPDAKAARDVGALRDRVHRLLLHHHPDRRLRRLGAGRPGPHHEDRQGRQHGGAAAGRAARRHAVPRLHRGGRLRHDPRGRRRPDAGRRLGALARHLRARRQAAGRPPSRSRCGWRAGRRSSSAIVAVLLGIVFKGQNVAFMVGLAFAIACSANFPALLLSIVWRRFTTAGAVASILTGSILTVLLDHPQPDGLGRRPEARRRRSSRCATRPSSR